MVDLLSVFHRTIYLSILSSDWPAHQPIGDLRRLSARQGKSGGWGSGGVGGGKCAAVGSHGSLGSEW